jgi:PST family polysaccharide transporter/lipopolysaccharide exporter
VTDLDRKLVRGSAWLALSFGGSQVVSLVIAAILAHFVAPSAFGLVALASVAVVALTTLQESGLGLAVIHRRTDVERAAGTAFVFTAVAAVVLYWAAFGLAPYLADLFSQPRLTEVLRILGLVLIVRGLGLVPGAMIERELVFASRAKGELGGTIVQAVVAVPLAISGFGVWSLVAGQLAGQAVQTATFWAVAPLRPSPRLFSFRILRELGRYGRHLTAANIVYFIDTNIDTATVGGLLNATAVGYYNMAWRLSNLPATGIGYIVGRVMFPAYSTLQDDLAAFRGAFLTNVRRVALVSLPVGVGILVAAHPIVVGLFGSRWEPAVVPLQILAVFGVIRAFSGTTGPVLQAAGRPQLVLLLNVWHLAVLCAALFTLTQPFGLKGAAWAVVIAAAASLVPAFRFALRILDLPLRELLANVERPAVCSVPLLLGLLAVLASTHALSDWLQLLALVVCGVAVYSASTLAFARGELRAITAAFRSS